MPLPKYLEVAVREVALSNPHEDWPSRRQHLIESGFDGSVVDSSEHEIRRYTTALVQKSIPRTIPPVPKQGNLPPSPESESSFPRYTTDPQASNLKTVILLIQGSGNSMKSEPIGCEHSEDEESKICLSALESRGLQSLISGNTIRLVWHKPQESGRTHPTIFRVVSDEEEDHMRADISFGRNWLKGAPLEIDNPTMGGKRKRNQGDVDEAERARELTRQQRPPTFGMGMGDPGDPVWVGTALRAYCNAGVHSPRYTSSGYTDGIEEEDSQSQERFPYTRQTTMQPPP
ncbi:uncharacterized protein K444DRAFT_606314, partial [Hyaloscypha bicolor E]